MYLKVSTFLHISGGYSKKLISKSEYKASSPHLWRYTAGQANDLLFLCTFICFNFRRYGSSQFLFAFLLLRCRQFNNIFTTFHPPFMLPAPFLRQKQIAKIFYSLLFLELNSGKINFISIII